MARSRLSLVLVLLLTASRFLNASQDDSSEEAQDDSDSSTVETQSPEQNLTSLLCVTFVQPGYTAVKLVVEDSGGTWDPCTVDLGDCATDYTDVLKVQAMNGGARKIYLKMSLGDCDTTCWAISKGQDFPTLKSVTRHQKEKKVECVKAKLPLFNNSSDSSCNNVKMQKRTKQPTTTLSSTESSVAPEEAFTNSILPPGHTPTHSDNATALHVQATALPAPAETKPTSPVLLTVVVLELVATCVMAVLVVWVVHSRGNSGITPATTDVRRNSRQDEVYICENDLYEPFTGPPAAQATGGQA